MAEMNKDKKAQNGTGKQPTKKPTNTTPKKQTASKGADNEFAQTVASKAASRATSKANSTAKRKVKKQVKKQVKKHRFLRVLLVLLILVLALGALYHFVLKDSGSFNVFVREDNKIFNFFGFGGKGDDKGGKGGDPSNVQQGVITDGDLQIHFLELGNKYTGDCTYVKAGEVDILIDAGSRTSNVNTIKTYIDQYVTDGKLEYVIVTHAHQDHYAGFTLKNGSIFDLYDVDVIIDFALTNQTNTGTNMYSKYLAERDEEIAAGATHYTAAECIENDNATFALTNEISMTILDNYYYFNASEDENNYSVCTMFSYGENNYLFTGDLETEGELKLVERNELPHMALYKAGHHGSKTSSTAVLLAKISPDIVCVCCCAGSPEYTTNNENQFPTQAMIDRVAPYTDKVYVTTLCVDYAANEIMPMNGNIVVSANATSVSVKCSASDLILKQTEWFKNNRTTPDAWQ